jgi:hypothetical protein
MEIFDIFDGMWGHHQQNDENFADIPSGKLT